MNPSNKQAANKPASRSTPSPRAVALGVVLSVALVSVACADSPSSPDAVDPVTPEALSDVELTTAHAPATMRERRARRRWLRRLRRATRQYRDFDRAIDAGYDVQATPCQETDAGGMGYHYANFGLIDGQLEPLRPEILLYEPQRNGRWRLVAVEYAIPYAEWDDSLDPPEIHGVPFDRNDVFNLWVLHAWVFKKNPAGTFEGWNPRVTCAYDEGAPAS